ncbi:hypothetical protein BH10PSE18_BH10PSE18_47940 [soil metagenome]
MAEVPAIVEHGKAPADELDGPAVDATGLLTVLHWSVTQASLILQRLTHDGQLTVSQGRQQIAGEDGALVPALGQPPLREEIHAISVPQA